MTLADVNAMYSGTLIEDLDAITSAVLRRRLLLEDDAKMMEWYREMDPFQEQEPCYMHGYEPEMERERR